MAQDDAKAPPQPISLGDHDVADERRARIVQHIEMLSQTARSVSDELAFAADTYDIAAVLDQNADDEHPGEQ